MATSLTPDELPNRRTDGRACDESCTGTNQALQGMSVSSDARMGAATAALPPIADMASAAGQVCFVPEPDVTQSFVAGSWTRSISCRCRPH